MPTLRSHLTTLLWLYLEGNTDPRGFACRVSSDTLLSGKTIRQTPELRQYFINIPLPTLLIKLLILKLINRAPTLPHSQMHSSDKQCINNLVATSQEISHKADCSPDKWTQILESDQLINH